MEIKLTILSHCIEPHWAAEKNNYKLEILFDPKTKYKPITNTPYISTHIQDINISLQFQHPITNCYKNFVEFFIQIGKTEIFYHSLIIIKCIKNTYPLTITYNFY